MKRFVCIHESFEFFIRYIHDFSIYKAQSSSPTDRLRQEDRNDVERQQHVRISAVSLYKCVSV